MDNIEIRPLLLRKGQTKLALYGLGSVRDERLCKTYMEGKVKMTKPNDGPESWFNLFVIHQNRYVIRCIELSSSQFLNSNIITKWN